MRLSKRSEYGIRALLLLAAPAANGSRAMLQIKEISERENIPAKYLEQILLALKNAGILHSKMGLGGGYYLAKPANQISLGHIIRELDGPIAPIRCVSQMAYEPCGCPDEASCSLRLVMFDVRAAMTAILDNTSLADALARAQAQRDQNG